jgi:hypothetical protein
MHNLWKATIAASAVALVNCSAPAPTGAGSNAGSPDEPREETASSLTQATCGLRHVATGGDASPGNTCLAASHPCASIGQAISAACDDDKVFVGAGTFVENVVVDKALTIFGLGDRTVIVPAVSGPDPCDDSSLCGGAASSVILVRASHVTVAALTVDGDNPALTSGVVVGGADVDARNGIITDIDAVYDDLAVVGTSVKNVYLRGIDAASGGSFRFEGNRVRNLSADTQAIGIFDTGGAGTIADNIVASSPAGVAANFSGGVTIARNRIAGAGGGVHTDNAGLAAGATSDAIVDNVVTDCSEGGFGLFAFSPGLPVTFRGNRVVGCSVGLAAFGEQATGETRFVGNLVDGRGAAGTLGIYATTSELEFGSSNVRVVIDGNRVVDAAQDIFVEQQPGFTATAGIRCNAITGAAGLLIQAPGTTVTRNAIVTTGLGLDASALPTFAAPDNWWGCPGGPGNAGCSTVTPNVDPDPVAARPALCTLIAPL